MALAIGQSQEFEYTGDIQNIILEPGQYKLEVWGAQGGDITGYSGGKGGYSSGIIHIENRETFYIVVGGSGVGATAAGQSLTGGYNGGGHVDSATVNHICASGGGATHIAKVNGLLSSLSSNKESILIVAGGGGGARNQPNHEAAARWGTGGVGGGLSGGGAVSSYGSTSTMTTVSANAGTQVSGYAFGQGGYAVGNSGGGGGWYGGYSGTDGPGGYTGSGSGGSGYIDGVTNGTSTSGENSGNGKAKITCISVDIDVSGEDLTIAGGRKTFEYTGQIESVLLHPGRYLLETWGASGGDSASQQGGKGGYSVGYLDLTEKTTVYIGVGGVGTDAQEAEGGWNGGGASKGAYGSGGGATHIATKTGLLNTLLTNSSQKDSVLMVAGGGGGAGIDSQAGNVTYSWTINPTGSGTYTVGSFVCYTSGYQTLTFYTSNRHMYYFTLYNSKGTLIGQSPNIHLGSGGPGSTSISGTLVAGETYTLKVSSSCSNFKGSVTQTFTTTGGTLAVGQGGNGGGVSGAGGGLVYNASHNSAGGSSSSYYALGKGGPCTATAGPGGGGGYYGAAGGKSTAGAGGGSGYVKNTLVDASTTVSDREGNGLAVITCIYCEYRIDVTKTAGVNTVENVNGALSKIQSGEEILLKATLLPGYDWSHWSEDYEGTDITLSFTMPKDNVKVQAHAIPRDDTLYKVNHHLAKLDNKTYELQETVEFQGTTDTDVTPPIIEYPGFVFPSLKTVNIDGDGSTVVDYYYTRDSFTLTVINGVSDKYEYLFGETGNLEYTKMDDASEIFKYWCSDQEVDIAVITDRETTFEMPYYDCTIFVIGQPNRLNTNIYKNIFPEEVFDMDYINKVLDVLPQTNNDITQRNHGFIVGDVIYVDSKGVYKKALAENSERGVPIGIVSDIKSNNVFTLTRSGLVDYSFFYNYKDTTILYLSDVTPGRLLHYQMIKNNVYIPVAMYTKHGLIINIQDGTFGAPLHPYGEIPPINFEPYSSEEINEIIQQITDKGWC